MAANTRNTLTIFLLCAATVSSSHGESRVEQLQRVSKCMPDCYEVGHGPSCFSGPTNYSDGSRLYTHYQKGRATGQGLYVEYDGSTYIGGIEVMPTGNYRGLWRKGAGIVYNSAGLKVQSGIWEDNKFLATREVDERELAFICAKPSSRIADGLSETPREKPAEPSQQLAEAPEQGREDRIRQENPTKIEKRVALVIGNSRYRSQPLKNPANDAQDIANRLKSLGFKVFLETDLSLNQMRRAVRRFADEYARSDVGLIYYSGHGVETNGSNYLIPINADVKREYELTEQAYPASQLTQMFETMQNAGNKERMAILILDACRNNDLPRGWRSVGKGLARMDAPKGTFISFATAPGAVAFDGDGRNSPFTKYLLLTLDRPNLSIEKVFKEVRVGVVKETKNAQVPWESSSLMGDFYFNRLK